MHAVLVVELYLVSVLCSVVLPVGGTGVPYEQLKQRGFVMGDLGRHTVE